MLSVAVLGATPASAQVNNPLTPAELNICQDLDMCVDIMLRHDPDGFDYRALSKDFQRLGEPALRRLLQLMASDREVAVKHAQYVLSDRHWKFPLAAQTQIAQLWPRGDIDVHSNIMFNILTNHGTPLMRDRMIATLSHPNADVRAQSRDVLKDMKVVGDGTGLTGAPVPPAAFPDLVKAAADDATPEILTLIGTFPQAQSAPVLARFLLSEDADITTVAYAQLYKQNPDAALSLFKAALPNLKTPRQALALSQLLQARHSDRQRQNKDGFYMHLAQALVVDKALPPLAHMMAMDAVMNSAPLEGKPLPNTPHVQAVFNNLVTKSGMSFLGYAYDFEKKAGTNTTQFLPLIWAEILRRDKVPDANAIYTDRRYLGGFSSEDTPYRFMDRVGQLAKVAELRGATVPILRQALRYDKDWRVQRDAAIGLGHAGDKTAQTELARISQSHPIVDVRAAARSALSGIASGTMNIEGDYGVTLKAARSCPVDAFDFVEDAKQLPFFEDGEFWVSMRGISVPAKRRYLISAFPTKSGPSKTGWLAGYNAGKFSGALLYYDNVSGDYEVISTEHTLAIIPVKSTPLGTLASEFWVVQGLNHLGVAGHISYLRFENGVLNIRRHLKLPSAVNAINIAPDQSLQMAFGDTHPPLRLLPNGKLVDGCAPSSAGAAQSLPN